MNENCDLLLEHKNITKDLEHIRDQIFALKDITETKMKIAQNEDERSNIFIDFKGKVDKIQQDKNTKKKYRSLQKRKLEIESTLSQINNKKQYMGIADTIDTVDTVNTIDIINCGDETIMDDIEVLIKKYKKFINIPIENNLQPQTKDNMQTNDNMQTKDNMQIKNLHKLIESLKMEIDM